MRLCSNRTYDLQIFRTFKTIWWLGFGYKKDGYTPQCLVYASRLCNSLNFAPIKSFHESSSIQLGKLEKRSTECLCQVFLFIE